MKTLVCLISLLGQIVLAEPPKLNEKSGSWSESQEYEALVKRGKPVNMTGTVLTNKQLAPDNLPSKGFKFELETDNGKVNVQVGPRWYENTGNGVLQPGEKVSLVGFQISFDKKPEVVAREITINGKTMTVWEKNGEHRSLSTEKNKNK